MDDKEKELAERIEKADKIYTAASKKLFDSVDLCGRDEEISASRLNQAAVFLSYETVKAQKELLNGMKEQSDAMTWHSRAMLGLTIAIFVLTAVMLWTMGVPNDQSVRSNIETPKAMIEDIDTPKPMIEKDELKMIEPFDRFGPMFMD